MRPTDIRRPSIRHFTSSIAVVSILFVVECSGGELTITNQSFENLVLADGVFVGSVPGWIQQGTTITSNPNNSFFSNTTDGSPNSPIDGLNAAAVNVGGKLVYQDTNWLIQPDVVYTLTFLAGYRIGSPFGNSSVSFWAGTNRLAEKFPAPAENTFASFSLNYTSPPTGPVLALPLRIELKAMGTDSQAWFDNFHLFTTNHTCTPHKATATAQLFNGILVGVTITDSGCGYSNAPIVTIQGGGGSNATATASISGGRVSGIQINNGGCCYTNLPTVVIESPPHEPTVAIRFSKVIVTQNVSLGRRYVLEYSSDLGTWTATGPAFTATSETIEDEFDVSVTGRFFRLREVP